MRDLDEISPAKWTASEALSHLTQTFESAVKGFPDIMESSVVRLVEARDDAEKTEIMRAGLKNTIRLRYPGTDWNDELTDTSRLKVAV